jgi:hypothetical protein
MLFRIDPRRYEAVAQPARNSSKTLSRNGAWTLRCATACAATSLRDG